MIQSLSEDSSSKIVLINQVKMAAPSTLRQLRKEKSNPVWYKKEKHNIVNSSGFDLREFFMKLGEWDSKRDEATRSILQEQAKYFQSIANSQKN